MRTTSLLVLFALVGCGASTPSAPADLPHVTAGEERADDVIVDSPEEVTTPAVTDAEVMFATELDLDGSASLEPASVHVDGTVVVGGAVGRVQLDGGQPIDEHLFGIVDGYVVVGVPQADEEDPPRRWTVFRREGAQLVRIFEQILAHQYVDHLGLVVTDQEVSVRETYNMTCGRYWEPRGFQLGDMEDPVPVNVDRIVFDHEGAELRHDTLEDEIDCRGGVAACPFVYLVSGDEETLMGEVLRHVRGEDAYTAQSLALTGSEAGAVTVRIREEKSEVTFLDQVTLRVEGAVVLPTECQATPAPAFCEADHQAYRLGPDDALTLHFEAPAGAREIVATGYYIPVPPG